MKHVLLLSLGFASLAGYVAARQQDFSKVEIQAIPAAGAVTMLVGAGGNLAVQAGDDGVLLVDDQFAPLEPKIRAAIEKLSKKPVRFLVNTHYHGDHTGGNALFGKDATVVAQENVRKRLEAGDGGRRGPMPKEGLPVVSYPEQASIHWNGEEIRLVHVGPAHTDGDTLVYFAKSNVLHTGDVFVNRTFPFVDARGGGRARGYVAGVERALQIADANTKIIPGHGPIATVEDLKGYLAFWKEAIAIVEAGLAAGKTAEQMKSEKAFAQFEKLSGGFVSTDAFLEALHRDLSQK